jgi:hypothetical protein
MASVMASASDLILNGGFENGLSGWTAATQLGNAYDEISEPFAGYSPQGAGYVPPAVGFSVLDPYAGSFSALGDSNASSAYVLTQNFTLPSGTTSVVLSFWSYIFDWSGQSTVGNGLAFDQLNQHVRVDILRNGVDAYTTAPADIVTSLFVGASSDPTVDWALSNYDLTASLQSGQSYILRFATVSSTFTITHGIDEVSLNVEAVPEPAMLMAFGIPALFAIRRRRSA